MLFKLLILPVLTGTIAALKTCCPGENVYDFHESKCTEKWPDQSTNTINIAVCEAQVIMSEEKFSEEMITDSCSVRLINDPDYDDLSQTLYIMCLNENLTLELKEHIRIANVRDYFIIISAVFLSLTIVVYAVLPELRDLQGICILHSLCSLLCAYILLIIMNSGPSSATGCQLVGITMYLSFIYTFWWLLILSFHIWRTTVKSSSCKTFNWCRLYHVFGTLAPLASVGTLLLFEHHPAEFFEEFRPGFGVNSCWFEDDREIWLFFYGPLVAILCLNGMFYVWTIVHLWKQMANSHNNQTLKYSYRVRMCAKLCIIMGMTWIIEIVTFSYKSHIDTTIKYIFFVFIPDLFNLLQGVLVFLILVVFRKKVRSLLAQKTFCGQKWFPNAWAQIQDEEMEGESIQEAHIKFDGSETIAIN